MSHAEIEQHRRECEARYVLNHFATKQERKAWLDSIGKKRGEPAQKYLEVEVIRQHKLMRERECQS